MQIIHAGESFPPKEESPISIFLAGPSPRPNTNLPSWRGEAIRLLEDKGFNGDIYSPEPRDRVFQDAFEENAYAKQVEWETEGLTRASCILFWVPADPEHFPAMTTRVEFGEFYKAPCVVYGRPKGAWKTRYLDYKWKKEYGKLPHEKLEDAIDEILTTCLC